MRFNCSSHRFTSFLLAAVTCHMSYLLSVRQQDPPNAAFCATRAAAVNNLIFAGIINSTDVSATETRCGLTDYLRPAASPRFMTTIILKYHTVVTLRKLAASRILERVLGRVTAGLRATLVGCIVLKIHARSYLPAALGGTAARLDASDDTLSLADSSFACSPAGRKLRGASIATLPMAPDPSPAWSILGTSPQLSSSSPYSGRRLPKLRRPRARRPRRPPRRPPQRPPKRPSLRGRFGGGYRGPRCDHGHPPRGREASHAGVPSRRWMTVAAAARRASSAVELQVGTGVSGRWTSPIRRVAYVELARATAECEGLDEAAVAARLRPSAAEGRARAARSDADASFSLLSSTSSLGAVSTGGQRPVPPRLLIRVRRAEGGRDRRAPRASQEAPRRCKGNAHPQSGRRPPGRVPRGPASPRPASGFRGGRTPRTRPRTAHHLHRQGGNGE